MSESPTPKDKGGSRNEANDREADLDAQAQAGPRVSRMRVGDEDILVLSVPLPKLRYPVGTTSAEHEIIDLVLHGLTAKEIAVERNA
ncbi:MAG: hypothetical protein OES69_05920, partial [Myxococcales bacterium]|nr:hypothetical protein [Myxococcales bacterium]